LVETPEEKRRRLLSLAKEAISKAYSTGEHSIAQAINAYNEIEKSRNLLHERIEEWYGIYFPELVLGSAMNYARFVIEIGGNKKQANKEALRQTLGSDADEIALKIERSIGAEPEENEYKALKSLAVAELDLMKVEDGIDAYLKESVPKLMPNVSYLVDYKLAAELLSRAGSLTKLANMPSSTLQLLGAEKALFRHLRSGSKPPKYGVLFKLKEVVEADRNDRGRVARLFATKLSIAARADAFSKRFIGKQLRESIDSTLKQIKENGRRSRPHREAQGSSDSKRRWRNYEQGGRFSHNQRRQKH
jgi:nucleolar protein 56